MTDEFKDNNVNASECSDCNLEHADTEGSDSNTRKPVDESKAAGHDAKAAEHNAKAQNTEAASETIDKEACETDKASDAHDKSESESQSDTQKETQAGNAEDKTAGDARSESGGDTAADTDASDDAESSDSDKKDKRDKQIEELNDKYKRLFAEFDNFRKRTEAEKTSMFAEGERTVLLKVLPLIDNFERAIDSIPEEQKGTALAEGIDKTYKAFMAQLTELGVTPIDACGKGFDANLHNAVMHVEDDSVEDNIVVEEFQKGYMFKDKVLRYSMVKVAN